MQRAVHNDAIILNRFSIVKEKMRCIKEKAEE